MGRIVFDRIFYLVYFEDINVEHVNMPYHAFPLFRFTSTKSIPICVNFKISADERHYFEPLSKLITQFSRMMEVYKIA